MHNFRVIGIVNAGQHKPPRDRCRVDRLAPPQYDYGSQIYHNVSIRSLIIFAAALATFAVSTFGFNRGVVLCTDANGHLALELAHVSHSHSHEDCSGHDPEEAPGGPDLGELHAAPDACSDSSFASVEQRACRQDISQLHAAHAAPCLNTPISGALIPHRSVLLTARAHAAPTDSAGLGFIVLLV